MISPRQWSIAFARQARADLKSRVALSRTPGIPRCQHLHFLQMACEKLCKAFLCTSGSDPADLLTSHRYIAKVLPQIAKRRLGLKKGRYPRDSSQFVRDIRLLARLIELLAPAVDDNGRRPDNCEYPWEDKQGNLQVPIEYAFPNLSLLHQLSGARLLKIVEKTVDELAGSAGI